MSRTSHPRSAILAIAGLAIVAAACGSPAATASPSAAPSATPAGSVAPSGAPAGSPWPSAATAPGLLLEVTTEGGFINPAATIGALPQLVVDTDGRIYTPGVSTGPSTPLIAPVDVRSTGAAGAAAILAAMRAAGLDKEGAGGIAADAGSTVFTAVIDGVTVVSRFGGGGPGPVNHGGAPGDSGAPGAAATALLAQLTDPTVAWGGSAGTPIPYAATAYRVWTAPSAPVDTGNGGPAVAWPLATGPADFGSPAAADLGVAGLRSGIVTGADAVALAAGLAGASPATPITSGGTTYRVWIRALFPDELGS
jgi:hypothetical protein